MKIFPVSLFILFTIQVCSAQTHKNIFGIQLIRGAAHQPYSPHPVLSMKGFEIGICYQRNFNKTFSVQSAISIYKPTIIKTPISTYDDPSPFGVVVNKYNSSCVFTLQPIVYLIKDWVFLQIGAKIGYYNLPDITITNRKLTNYPSQYDYGSFTSKGGIGFGYYGGLGNHFKLSNKLILEAQFSISRTRINIKNAHNMIDGITQNPSNFLLTYPSFNVGLGLFRAF
jgi:hypothetical protein